mgnify:CR=1
MAQKTTGWRSLRQRIPRLKLKLPNQDSEGQSAVATYYLILFPALLLGILGLMMGFSATAITNISAGVNPYVPFLKTVAISFAALVLAIVAAHMHPRFWDRTAFALFAFALILQLLVIPFGIGVGGNVNWLPIPGTGQVFQPSELLKLATALFLARALSGPQVDLKNWKQVLMVVGVPSGLAMGAVMLGHDMGTMLIFLGLTLGAIWVAGVPARWFASLFAFGGAGLILLIASSPSRTRRVIEFLPGFGTEPSTSAPTQTDHGLWALGSGGLTGLGPGASREKWNYLQEAHTDFIIAIIGEEFGLLGTLTLLLLFGLMIYGILRLAANSGDSFERVASGAIGSWFIIQGMINVGTVIGLAPVIGVPFPLVSYGGSSLLITAVAIGVLLSFARSEANLGKKGRFDPDTAGLDPRKARTRRRVK